MMEPTLINEGSRFRGELNELVFDLTVEATGYRRSLPIGMAKSLAGLVRSMNCYYSNLIEGHNTHPIEIEKALKGEFSRDTKKRNLQKEAKAHIEVQKWIDEGGLRGATTVAGLREIHRRFYSHVPEELKCAENPETHERLPVEPGKFRLDDVRIGRLVPISPGAIPQFMERFEAVYTPLGKSEAILSSAAAHHRLVWIHPFPDGNGRVARLMSHAVLSEALDSGATWSVARGLARKEKEYKEHLANCDRTRRNDLDGRGNLSEEALVDFTRFFLETCIDQVDFMDSLFQPSGLRRRIRKWAEEERINPRAILLLEAILYRGEMTRGEATEIICATSRTMRRMVADLLRYGVITANVDEPLRIAFPVGIASRWMPELFPRRSEAIS
jgi:Fic family protein